MILHTHAVQSLVPSLPIAQSLQSILPSNHACTLEQTLVTAHARGAPVNGDQPLPNTDWRWQMRHTITSREALEAQLSLTQEEREGVHYALSEGFPLSITPHYFSLIDKHNPQCPIRLQCIPRAPESRTVRGDLRDPLGEEEHEVAPFLVQRYPDRALLLVSDRCSVYCRFCTRSRMVGAGGGAISLEKLAPALAYLRAHSEVRDVIVSGGDPLLMATERICELLKAITSIESIDTVRLATRIPVTLPQRITTELVDALRAYHPLWLMTHFNHARELTLESTQALLRLVDAGFPVMNQTVLLRGVNDDAPTLETLFRGLIKRRVRPYYLLQADVVKGTSHMRTPIDTGLRIMEALQGRLTGIALPKYIVDTPRGRGKVPLQPHYYEGASNGVHTLRTFRNELVDYVDPPTD